MYNGYMAYGILSLIHRFLQNVGKNMNNIGNWWRLKISQEFVTSSLNGWIFDELTILMWNKNMMNSWDI